MSYKQAVKFSHNHRKDRFYQPIILGEFKETPHECCFVPHHNKVGDPKPDYYFCLRCGKKEISP